MLNVHILHHAEVNDLIRRFPNFSILNCRQIPRDSMHQWWTTTSHWNYYQQETYSVQVMFIGKTGYGKSTTINKLTGTNRFDTDAVNTCTRDLYTAMYRVNQAKHTFLEFSDLPGIGESSDADRQYLSWYREMLDKSDVVVYVLRADQRDYAEDEKIFRELLQKGKMSRVILAINYADKMEPANRKPGLSQMQKENLERRRKEVARVFQVPLDSIIYYSAADEINLNQLADKIAGKVSRILC